MRDVYRRATSIKPSVQVTAAVFPSLASAENVFQDWPSWIRQGIVDYVGKTVDPRLERITRTLTVPQRLVNPDAINTLRKLLGQEVVLGRVGHGRDPGRDRVGGDKCSYIIYAFLH